MQVLRNSQFKNDYWHRLNLVSKNKSLGKEDCRMISPVSRRGGRFETRLSFSTFDWLLAEKIASLEINIEKLDSRQKV